MHSAESQRAEPGPPVCEESFSHLPSTHSDEALSGPLSPVAHSAGNAMEETTPDVGSRKRKGDDCLILGDEQLLQALPAVWPGRKIARRRDAVTTRDLSFLHSDS